MRPERGSAPSTASRNSGGPGSLDAHCPGQWAAPRTSWRRTVSIYTVVLMQIQDLIAGLALVLSMISLLWQVRTWRSSGPFIKVGCGPAEDVIFSFGEPTEAQIQHNEAQRALRRHYFIVVRNRGRAPATIEKAQIGTRQSAILDLAQYVVAKPSDRLPPLRLEPAASVQWLIPLEKVMDGIHAELELRTGNDENWIMPRELRIWVTVGNGDEIVSPLFPDDPFWLRLWMPRWLVATIGHSSWRPWL